jgi:hypothetical protein
MNSIQMDPGQKAVEQHYKGVEKIQVDPDKTALEQFGTMESWIFQLGEYRLFLNPLTKTWYYYDRIHDDWKDLKHPSGSGFFYLDGDNLEFSRSGAAAPAPSLITCPKCGISLNPNLRFCNQCGAAVSAISSPSSPKTLHFCPHCRAQINEGVRFCNSCGKKLG